MIAKQALGLEKQYVQNCLRHCFGYHLLAISDTLNVQDLVNSCMPDKIIGHSQLKMDSQLVLDHCDLPFANDSLDVLILHHQLEHSVNPRQALLEIERVLISHGQAILLGMPLHRFFSVKRYAMPRRMPHAFSLAELNALLTDTSLAIEDMHCLQNAPVGWFESLQRICQPVASYAIQVRKKTFGHIPLKNTSAVYAQPCTSSNSFNRVLAPNRKQSALGQ